MINQRRSRGRSLPPPLAVLRPQDSADYGHESNQPSTGVCEAACKGTAWRAAPRMFSFALVLGFECLGNASVDASLEIGGLAEVATVIHSSVLSWAERIFALARLIRDFTVPTSQPSRAAISP